MSKCKTCGARLADTQAVCKSCGTVRTFYQSRRGGSSQARSDESPPRAAPAELNARLAADLKDVLGPAGERYELLKTLGMGAVGMVYQARERASGQLVAIKVLRPDLRSNKEILRRFSTEIEIARKLRHPNIARVLSFNDQPGRMFIVMEYIEGVDLASYQRRHNPSMDRKLAIMRAVCDAVQTAHDVGIVHRDLKPGNILIGQDDKPWVLDFGIALMQQKPSITHVGSFIGTPLYMSPEQAQGRHLDHRSDIYSLGVIFYELVAGRAPFLGDSAIAIALKHINETPFKPRSLKRDIPQVVERVILRCLAKDPADRPQQARDIVKRIDDSIAEEIARVKQVVRSSGASDASGLGDLADISLFQYLRGLVPRKRDFVLELVQNEEFARFHFQQARLVHGETSSLRDEEVAYNLFYWVRGSYRVVEDSEPPERASVEIPWLAFVENYLERVGQAVLGVHGQLSGPVIVDLLDRQRRSLYRYVSDPEFEAQLGERATLDAQTFGEAQRYFQEQRRRRIANSDEHASSLLCHSPGLRHSVQVLARPQQQLDRVYEWIREQLERQLVQALHNSLRESDLQRRGRGLRKVLLAEGEEFLGNLIRIKLRTLGCEVFLVRDGTRALEVAEQVAPDVLVLDVNVGGISAYDVLRVLRARRATRKLPVLLLTPWRGGAGKPQAAVHELPKPVDLAELSEQVLQLGQPDGD